jgi:endogenous inhibitor of DNA gyrase (YacG/DUF329 family)
MGLYDCVAIDCPACGTRVEFQSKAGNCTLHTYTIQSAPKLIAADLDGAEEKCSTCGRAVRLQVVCQLIVS